MPKPLPDELYHYTGIAGLKGIIESQTLWATHYKYLNDGEEVVHFQELLPHIVRPILKRTFENFSPLKAKMLLNEYSNIEAAVDGETKKFTTVLFDIFLGTGSNRSFSEPYIVSFCTVDTERVATDGLLSQWRGYGLEGGYVIIFDTKKLIDLLTEEGKRWAYLLAFGGDVVYSSASEDEINAEFGERFNEMRTAWEKGFGTQDIKDFIKTYKNFVSCACCYKHWGFSEEREFRIVVVPVPFLMVESAKKDESSVQSAKPISSFIRKGTVVPYLNLFEGITQSSKQLPIKRIIVGPHPDKERRKLALEKLLRQNNIDAEVSVSAIPYLG